MKNLREVIDRLCEIYDEFGDVGTELYDAYDMEMLQPLTDIRYDNDRQRVQFLSER